MSGKDKNGKDQLSDFLRYHGNKMTDKERNAFERRLQKDLFADEASEGFEAINTSMVKNDLKSLRRRMKDRTSGRQKILWYRVAASVAVLLIISSIYLIIEIRRPSEQISYFPAPQASEEITIKQNQEKSGEENLVKEPVIMTPEVVRKDIRRTQQIENNQDKKDEQKKEEIILESQEAIMAARFEEPEKIISGDKAMVPQYVSAKKVSGTYPTIRGRIISSEDNQPIPGVNITVKGTNKVTVTDTGGNFILREDEARNRVLIADFIGMVSKEFKAVEDSSMEIKLEPSLKALNEIVLIGYGAKGNEYRQEDEMTGYIPPRPVTGKADFDKYIKENLRIPDADSSGQRIVVVLDFMVDVNGKIDSIKVIRSPGKIFSDEAIRLIKDGPIWEAAEENGKVIKDEVRIRIVFK